MTEDKFFDLEEQLVELLALYIIGTEERDLDFDDNIKTLIERAKE